MVKPGIHFPRKYYTLVLQHGATIRASTIFNIDYPIFLDTVRTTSSRRCCWIAKQSRVMNLAGSRLSVVQQ